jgi:integrase
LADGTVRTYYYAWRGGPRLDGEPGTPAFMASYNKAIADTKKPKAGDLKSLIAAFKKSTDYTGLADRTQRDYAKQIGLIEAKFGALPIAFLDTKGIRGTFLSWRDDLAAKSERQADYTWTVLARILSWSKGRGLIDANPCERGGRIYEADRTDKIWTDEQEAAFMATAPAHLKLALQLALWTGQRQGDLLALPWSAYDGESIRLRQSKTGERVTVPAGKPLKVLLDDAPRRAKTILTNTDGAPWTSDGFRSSWRKACAAAGVTGVTFHDLRGTAVTRLAIVECTESEIATLTGHSLKDVRSILDTHYLSRDIALAKNAVRKLEGRKPSL